MNSCVKNTDQKKTYKYSLFLIYLYGDVNASHYNSYNINIKADIFLKKKTEPHTTGMEGKCNEIKESNAIQRVFPLLCHVINRI